MGTSQSKKEVKIQEDDVIPIQPLAPPKPTSDPLDFSYCRRLSSFDSASDPFFPPTLFSLIEPCITKQDNLKSLKSLTWVSLTSLKDICLFKDTKKYQYETTGLCENGWLIQAIIQIANTNFEIIRHVFEERHVGNSFRIKLWVDGQPRQIQVDDMVPWDGEKYAFSNLKYTNEVWLQILEKAVAKVFGSYLRLENAEAGEVFSMITGAPNVKLKHKDEEYFDEFLSKNRNLFAAPIPRKLRGKGLTSQPGNSYQILEYTSNHFRISNPFLESLKGDCISLKDFEGKKWIDITDYKLFFEKTVFNYYKLGYIPTWHQDFHKMGRLEYCVEEFEISEDSPEYYIISLNQINCKQVDKSNRGSYQYAPMKMALVKIEEDDEIISQTMFVESAKSSKKGDATISMKIERMKKGKYLIVFQVDWIMVEHNERKMVLNTYAPTELKVKSVKSKQFNETFINTISYWIESRVFGQPQPKLKLPLPVTQDYISKIVPEYSLQDFDIIDIKYQAGLQQQQVFYKFIFQDESIRELKKPTDEFQMTIKSNSSKSRQHMSHQIFDTLFVDIIRQPIRAQGLKQGLKIHFSTEQVGKGTNVKVVFQHTTDRDGIILENTSPIGGPTYVIDCVIAATKFKKHVEKIGMAVAPNEKRHVTLYPESQLMECQDSTCFKLRIRPLGFDNIRLMARTVYKGCLPNEQIIFGSEIGFESQGTSYMHIMSEDEGYRFGVKEPDDESDRSIQTKWSAVTKQDGARLRDITLNQNLPFERDDPTPRNLRQDVGYNIHEEQIESFSSHASDYTGDHFAEQFAELRQRKNTFFFPSNINSQSYAKHRKTIDFRQFENLNSENYMMHMVSQDTVQLEGSMQIMMADQQQFNNNSPMKVDQFDEMLLSPSPKNRKSPLKKTFLVEVIENSDETPRAIENQINLLNQSQGSWEEEEEMLRNMIK